MKLLFIGNHFSGTGHNRNSWDELAMHLRQVGFEVITTSAINNKGLRLLDMLGTIWRTRKEFQVAQVDVFSGQAFIWAYLSVFLLSLLDKPIILSLHGGNLPEFGRRHPRWLKWVLGHAERIFVPSRYLLEQMNPYSRDLILLPNAIEIKNYPYINRVNPQPVLVWMRAFHEIYHPEMAVQVIGLLRKDFPRIHLTMIGPDKGDGSLQRTKKLALELGLENSVEFPGWIPKEEVPNWLNKADIFLNTTNIDNTPISVMEAMACGLCIVSTNVGGIPYLLSDGDDSLLIPPGDANGMAESVRRILTKPELASRLSASALANVDQFDWTVILPQWESVISSLNSS